jgi:hypothetical protein
LELVIELPIKEKWIGTWFSQYCFRHCSEVTLEISEKVKPNCECLSFDKQLLGQVAAKIRGFRKPEPYKGKGVKL